MPARPEPHVHRPARPIVLGERCQWCGKPRAMLLSKTDAGGTVHRVCGGCWVSHCQDLQAMVAATKR